MGAITGNPSDSNVVVGALIKSLKYCPCVVSDPFMCSSPRFGVFLHQQPVVSHDLFESKKFELAGRTCNAKSTLIVREVVSS